MPSAPGSGPNPYASPKAESPESKEARAAAKQADPPPGKQPVNEDILELMAQTRPWVKFLSILGFITSLLFMLLGCFMGLLALHPRATSEIMAGIVYIPLGFLYLLIAGFMFSYARSISELLSDRSMASLRDAVEAQKSFWRLSGLIALGMLILYTIFFLVPLVVGLFLVLSRVR